MKRIGMGLVLLGFSGMLRAQTFDEWFEQNKTRKEYNSAQVSALQTYIGYAEKGYSVMESGLHMIGDIKTGEFNLHNGFYASLGAINPAVAKMGEVAEIVALQLAIVERFKTALSRYGQEKGLGENEVAYISNVYAAVLADGLADVNTLLELLTADKLTMTDDQRVDRVRGLDDAMKARYAFTTGFTEQADLLGLQRQAVGTDGGTVKGLYGLQ